jgi:colanic acid/amylovoran biosynthesis protein
MRPAAAPDRRATPGQVKVAVIGTVLLNGGDAALLFAQRRTVEGAFGAVDLVVFDYQAEAAASRYPELDLRPSLSSTVGRRRGALGMAALAARMLRILAGATALRYRARAVARVVAGNAFAALDAYRDADMVMTPGGTFMLERYRPWTRLVDQAAVLLLRRPLVFFTQSFEPVHGSLARAGFGAVLRRARLVLVRGEQSVRRVRSLGVAAERVLAAPDAAFLFAGAAPSRDTEPSGRLRVAISVRSWPYLSEGLAGQLRYERAIGDLCGRLVQQHGADVVFVSTCQGAPEYWTDDSEVAARIAASLPAEIGRHVTVDRAFHRPDELLALLATFPIVIATRLHAAILALCGGAAVVAIGYADKTAEVFGGLGLGRWVVPMDSIEPVALGALVDDLIGERQAVAAQAAAAVAAEAGKAGRVAEQLRAVLA